MSTDIKGRALCAGKKADKSPCGHLAAAEMTFDGISYCMRHGTKIIQREQEVKETLERYREYQTLAFGALAHSWPIEALQGRLAALKREGRGGGDLYIARLDAEEAAITRELARRKGATV